MDRPLLAILLLALVVRLASIPAVHRVSYTSDEREYLAMGRTLIERGIFVDTNGDRAIRAPLYPFVTAGLLMVGAGSVLFLHVVGSLIGVINVVLTFLLTQKLWTNRPAALAASAGAALYPGLVIYSTLIQTETLYITFFLTALLVAVGLGESSPRWKAAALGVLCGLAALTRVVFLGFIPVVAGFVFTREWATKKKRAQTAGIVLLFALLTIAPWTVRNVLTLGEWVAICSGGGNSLLTGNNPYATGTYRVSEGFEDWFDQESAKRGGPPGVLMGETQRSAMSSRIALDYITTHPMEAVAGWAHKAYIFWVYPITHTDSDGGIQALAVASDVVLLALGWAGVLAMWFLRRRLVLIFAALLYFSAVQIVLHAEARFRLPLIPLMLMFAAWGWIPAGSASGIRGLLARVRERRTLLAGWLLIVVVYAYTAVLHLQGQL
jgi:hypothetical protein